MPSPKRTDQESSSPSERDGDKVQDNKDIKIKEEPADSGYEKAPGTPGLSENNSNSNSRSSSPCPPVHFGSMSPAQGRDSPSQGAGSSSSGPQTPLNDIYAGSSIRTHLHGTSTGKKTVAVQNIVEGLLKKNATLLAMSDTEGLRPQRRQKTQDFNNSRKVDQNYPSVNSSATFPISSTSQARLVQNQGRKSETSKPMLLRPKSPTKKCDSILRDKSQLSYSLMESAVGDETIEKIFKVQHHELVCAVSSKPYIFDKVNNEKTVVASLDNNYFWCNFCSFSSSNKSLITNHIMDHRFSCKFCPYESFCRSDILRHMGKTHEEFEEMTNNLSYCTFLSDYIRVKSRAEGKENDAPKVDQDEDVGELDTETMKSHHAANLKRKRELEDSQESSSGEKWAKVDSSDEAVANGPRSDRPGKSRKSQNPRRHPQVNEKDYDTFEMEVEEIDETENGNDNHSDRILYPSSSSENSNDHKNPSTPMGSHMQLIPSLQDEGTHGYTATHVSRTPPVRTGRPPTYMANNRTNNRGTHRTASASSLYWSCGYCDFQSSSQAEIKEHSNRTHPGKPHRMCLNPVVAKRGTFDDSQPLDEDELMSKDTSEADMILPNSLSGMEYSVSDVNRSDKYTIDQAGKRLIQSCTGCNEGPHDIYAEKVVHNKDDIASSDEETGESQYEVRESSSDNSDSKLSTFDDEDNLNTKSLDGNYCDHSKENDLTISLNEANCRDREHRASLSPLKLTFRTVGDTTICSLGEKRMSPSPVDSSILALKDGENIVDDGKTYSKKLEKELVDSSSDSDSDSDSCSFIPVGSMALSAPSISSECNTSDRDNIEKSESIAGEGLLPAYTTPVPSEEKSEKKFNLAYVPARSAAVKAMTKMKPVVDAEVEEIEGNETKYLGSKDRSCQSPLFSRNAFYTCSYCNYFGANPLRKVKSHLVNHHPLELPVVINLRIKQKTKNNAFYVCPFSSCNKLYSSYDALISHRSTHLSLSSYINKPKDRLTVSNYRAAGVSSYSSLHSPHLHIPSEAENIPQCRIMLHRLHESQLEALQLTNQPEVKVQGRYECLYCTEHFSDNTMSGMKQHYAIEHPSQLLVLRDIEAKKEKLASRIYACEETDCEFSSTSRADLDAHAKCHKSNCTFVYECAGCGWYSSSFWTAKDHLKIEHSVQDNVYLIHMQLSVDEYGHTSKKVLKSV